jgi:hypothetical protein
MGAGLGNYVLLYMTFLMRSALIVEWKNAILCPAYYYGQAASAAARRPENWGSWY